MVFDEAGHSHKIEEMKMRGFALELLFALLCTLAIPKSGYARTWPEDYVVYRHTESPDGQYGILVPSKDAGNDNEELGGTNFLAKIKTRELLGKIKDADYFEGQNHAGLRVVWAPDSRTCVAIYEGRYGFATVAVLQLDKNGFTQTNLESAIEKKVRPLFDGYLEGYFRFARDHKLLVRVLAYTNPKQFQEVPTRNALFQGTFDLQAKRWIDSTARKIASEQWDALNTAYGAEPDEPITVAADPATVPDNFTGTIFASEDQELESLDQTMNETYQAVRFLLPAARFAKVKEEQVAWLKQREAKNSSADKSAMTAARTKILLDLIW